MSESGFVTDDLSISYSDDVGVVRKQSMYERRFKRFFDVVGGAVLGLLALPVVAIIAVAVRVLSLIHI